MNGSYPLLERAPGMDDATFDASRGATTSTPELGEPEVDLLTRILERDLSLSDARAELILELEAGYVARALARTNGSVVRAAAASGVTRRYFHMLMARTRRVGLLHPKRPGERSGAP